MNTRTDLAELRRLWEDGEAAPIRWAQNAAAIWNALPALLDELEAAKDLLARIHRDGGHHTEAVGFAQSVADADAKVSEWLVAADARTALAAHVERLREVADGVNKIAVVGAIDTPQSIRDLIADAIRAKADRIATEAAPEVYDVWREAANGKA